MSRFLNKKFQIASLVLLLQTLFLLGESAATAQPPDRSGYSVSWFDEFDSSGVDTSKWNVANTNVTTNNSLQDYLPSQVKTESGQLVITSENTASRGLPYRSGLVTSTALQKYGRWDIRAKLPTSTGMWPAIWLLSDAPWPSEGEIDIMENRGDEANSFLCGQCSSLDGEGFGRGWFFDK